MLMITTLYKLLFYSRKIEPEIIININEKNNIDYAIRITENTLSVNQTNNLVNVVKQTKLKNNYKVH